MTLAQFEGCLLACLTPMGQLGTVEPGGKAGGQVLRMDRRNRDRTGGDCHRGIAHRYGAALGVAHHRHRVRLVAALTFLIVWRSNDQAGAPSTNKKVEQKPTMTAGKNSSQIVNEGGGTFNINTDKGK